MANILVQIELDGDKPDKPSLGLLNEGRVIASRLGATLYAMLPCDTTPSYGDNDIIAILSRHGADKVILLTHKSLGGEVTMEQKDVVIKLACERFPPRLLLLPARDENLELAASLAIHLEGQYTAMEHLGFTEADRTPTPLEEISSEDPTGDLPEGIRLIQECEGPLVLTLLPDAPPAHLGDEEAEVVVLHPDL